MLDLSIGKYKWDLSLEDIDCDLADILDRTAVQEILEEFHSLTGMSIALIDPSGKILVSAGWQEVCEHFHRKYPQSCQNCIDSDTVLSRGVKPGEFKLYKCKNGMWDIATPIYVQGRHLANIFFGQFFFTGEEPDMDFFVTQAERYAYNLYEYQQALRKVPHFSREEVAKAMSFYMHFARHISQLSHNNMKLQHNLIIRDKIFAAQKLQAMVLSQIHDRILITDLEGHVIYVNQAVMEATGFSQQELLEMNIRDLSKHPLSDSAHEELLQDTLRCGSSRMELQNSAKDGGELYVDIRTIRVDDDEGKPVALCAVGTEITERVIYLNLLRRQNAVNLKLTELSRLLLSARSDNFELMIDDFLQAVARLLNLDRSHIFLMDGLLPCIRKYYEWCQEGIESQLDKMRDIDAHTAPKMICELVAQRLVFIDDTQDLDKDWQAEGKFLKKRGVRALFAAPLVNEATILGFLGFDMVQEPRSWDEIDSMVIQITADLLAATIQRLRSESGTA